MRHAILGAGGLGGLIGAALARAGHPVTLVVRGPGHPTRIRLESRVLGDFESEVTIATTVPLDAEVLWVTVKAHQLESALASVPAGFRGQVVPLLNGVDHVARLRELYGRERVTPGTIRVESERVAPGFYRQASPFARIELAGPAAEAIANEMTAAGIETGVAADEVSMLWGKLAVLAPLALTTTSLQAPIGAVRSDPLWRERLLAIVAEATAAGRAEGAVLDPDATSRFVLAAPDQMQSSMQKDRAAGRPLELGAIAGAIQRAGRRHGIPTPVVDEVARELEQ